MIRTETNKEGGRMKIAEGHYDAMKAAIESIPDVHGMSLDDIAVSYEHGKFPRADKVKDLQKRFCFDLLHAANVSELVHEIYEYANDDHIFAALKRICPKVTRAY